MHAARWSDVIAKRGLELIRASRQSRDSAWPGDLVNLNTNTNTSTIAAILVALVVFLAYDVPRVAGADRPPVCQAQPDTPPDPSQPPPPPESKPTTVATIGQAYYCILDNYFAGPVLDNRSLLVAAFAGLTQELLRRGLDQPQATLPPFSGKSSKIDDDWAAFSQVYVQITAKLPADPAVRQAVAEATMRAMVGSLNDNHVSWGSSTANLSGISLSAFLGPVHLDPAAIEPLFVTEATGPAQIAGVWPGDEIVAINGVPPFVNGVLSVGAVKWITESKRDTRVELTLHRAATDATFTVMVMPGPSGPPDQGADSGLVDGKIGYVRIRGFAVEAVDRALAAIADLRRNTQLRGAIIDLRRNGGGSPEAVSRLLGALAHDKVFGYWCDAKGHCTENRIDDSVQLLNLPVVALIDRGCASACDMFASAVKDLHLATLVGTRTAGEVSGPADSYRLEDGSRLGLPKVYQLGANREIFNIVGVPPDHFAPLTAADLSAGRDPGLAKATELLQRFPLGPARQRDLASASNGAATNSPLQVTPSTAADGASPTQPATIANRPSPPTDVHATAVGSAIVLTWTSPESGARLRPMRSRGERGRQLPTCPYNSSAAMQLATIFRRCRPGRISSGFMPSAELTSASRRSRPARS
jgi:carboxyl-terminal processing protease